MISSAELDPNFGFLRDLQAGAEAEVRDCVVGALITDHLGRVFVQKRSTRRQLFPGCWDIAGGHVESGETLFQALGREIKEETGWDLARIVEIVDVFDWEVIVDERLVKKREFDFLVDVKGDLEHPRIQQSEFTEFRWITEEDLELLKENRANGDVSVYDLVRKFLTRPLRLN